MSKLLSAVLSGILLIIPVSVIAAQSPSSRRQKIEGLDHLARQYLQEKEPGRALSEYQAIVKLDPNNLDARANLGVLLFYQGNFKTANPQLRAALKLRPDLYRIQALLGMSERRTGEMDRARNDLQAAFPKLKNKRIQVQTGLELIGIYITSNDLTKAADVVGVLRSLEPANPYILYTAYQIYSEQTNEMILATAMAAPRSAEMHRIMGDELAREGNRMGAIEQYRQALKLDPRLPGLHFELGELLFSSTNPALQAQAKAQYEAALAVNKFDAKSDYRLGEIAERAGHLKQASLYFSKALQVRPNDAEILSGYAQVELLLNHRQKAAELLERSVQLNPTSAKSHYRLSRIYEQMGRSLDAKRQMKEFLKYRKEKERLRKLFETMHVHAGPQSLSSKTGSSATR